MRKGSSPFPTQPSFLSSEAVFPRSRFPAPRSLLVILSAAKDLVGRMGKILHFVQNDKNQRSHLFPTRNFTLPHSSVALSHQTSDQRNEIPCSAKRQQHQILNNPMRQKRLGLWFPGIVENFLRRAAFNHPALFQKNYFIRYSQCLGGRMSSKN